jgi:hypothetical protein
LVAAIADRVTEMLRVEPAVTRATGLVDAATVAATLGMSRDWVYAHAEELGGKRFGDGPRGRLRFDLDHALAAWTSRSVTKSDELFRADRLTSRPGTAPGADGIPMLPIRGERTPHAASSRSAKSDYAR